MQDIRMGLNVLKVFGKKCLVFVDAYFDAKTTRGFGESDTVPVQKADPSLGRGVSPVRSSY